LSISLLWRILFYGWTASEIYIAIATRTRRGSGKRLDRGSLMVLWLTILGSITAAEWIGGAATPNMFGGAHWLRITAVILIITAIVIRWTAILSLGKAFSANVAIRDSQTVYRKGLYKFVRHPSYSGLLLVFVAIALHERNWLAAAVVIVLPTLALLYRIHVEEQALRQAFGEEYESYCNTTKRLIPGIY
jgi:protein-S-isoprenylcysteine O-methyltransferase Ste14